MPTKNKRMAKMTTPFGTAAFCSLLRPSTKFNADGEYNAKVVLEEGPETDALIAQLDALYEQAYQENLATIQKDKPKITEIKRADKPYKRPEDPDTGESLPGWTINARLKRVRRDKDKNIVDVAPAPPVLDSTGTRPVTVAPGAGSIIRIQFIPGGFYTAALGSGLSLKLVGVQVKELVAIGGAKAEFDAVEGFVDSGEVPGDSVNQPNTQQVGSPADPAATGADEAGEW